MAGIRFSYYPQISRQKNTSLGPAVIQDKLAAGKYDKINDFK